MSAQLVLTLYDVRDMFMCCFKPKYVTFVVVTISTRVSFISLFLLPPAFCGAFAVSAASPSFKAMSNLVKKRSAEGNAFSAMSTL